MLSDEFNIPKDNKNDEYEFIITGVEKTEDISIEELNVQYLPISKAETQAQQQNMLFLANIGNANVYDKKLQEIAYGVKVELVRSSNSIGGVNENYIDDSDGGEYYNPKNIYSQLGYWPEEFYRFGIVFIKDDDSLSPVFNIIGCNIEDSFNSTTKVIGSNEKYLTADFDDEGFYKDKEQNILANKMGVFKNPMQKENTVIQFESNDYGIKKLETHP